jgi:hypothetical protein
MSKLTIVDNEFLQGHPSYKYVGCKFHNSQRIYTYRTTFDVKEGDAAIVQTPDGKFEVVEVVQLPAKAPLIENVNYKFLLAVIDTSAGEKVAAEYAALSKSMFPAIGRL